MLEGSASHIYVTGRSERTPSMIVTKGIPPSPQELFSYVRQNPLVGKDQDIAIMSLGRFFTDTTRLLRLGGSVSHDGIIEVNEPGETLNEPRYQEFKKKLHPGHISAVHSRLSPEAGKVLSFFQMNKAGTIQVNIGSEDASLLVERLGNAYRNYCIEMGLMHATVAPKSAAQTILVELAKKEGLGNLTFDPSFKSIREICES